MKRFISLLILLAGVAAAPAPSQAQSAGEPVAFGAGEVGIETAAGAQLAFQVEIAESPDQRAQGLMFRRQMAADTGMLFLFGGSQERAMWMKNTLIPLDMLFIDETGEIVRIEERTVPHSLRVIKSGQPVAAVLELNAGTTSRLAIKPGDRVIHPAFN